MLMMMFRVHGSLSASEETDTGTLSKSSKDLKEAIQEAKRRGRCREWNLCSEELEELRRVTTRS